MSRFKNLIALAAHKDTPDNEALSALRKVGKMIDDSSGGIDTFLSSPTVNSPPLSFNASRAKIDELEEQIYILNKTVNRLEKDNERLMTANKSLAEENTLIRQASKDRIGRIRDNGSLAYDEFSFRVKRILGDSWINEFTRQTGIDAKTLNKMRVAGVVDPDVVKLIATLTAPIEKPFWTTEEVAIIRKLAPEAKSVHELASLASIEISKTIGERVVTENQIGKLIVDSKGGNGVFKMTGYGKKPIIIGVKKKAAAFPWSMHPKIESEMAYNFIAGNGNRLPAKKWAERISLETGILVTEGMVKQRLNNNVPPKSIEDMVVTSGKLTWSELWVLGSKLDKRAWNQSVWNWFGMSARRIGDDLSDIPQQKIENLRNYVREQMSEREIIVDVVKRHPNGISRQEIREQCSMFGVSSSNRVAELVKNGFLLEDGELIRAVNQTNFGYEG